MQAASRARVERTQTVDGSPSEHIYMGSDNLNPDPQTAAKTMRERVELRNGVRRMATELTLYAEGFLKVAPTVRGKRGDVFRLDLHYLDPVPAVTKVIAKRSLYAALGCAAAAGCAFALRSVEPLEPFVWYAFAAAVAATLAAVAAAVYRSHVRFEFATIHGRAPVLTLLANLGSIRRFRAFMPVLTSAIDEAAEAIGSDTAAYLRAEMREHYRLREDGVLDHEQCAAGTGRILAQFEVQL
jgi:hypothetical protein